jgi:hypothetical protein
MISGGGSICSDELWYLPEYCVVPRLQVLGGFLDVVIVCKELLPVVFLLLPNGIMVLLRRTFSGLF